MGHRMSNLLDVFCRVCGEKCDTWPSKENIRAVTACKKCRNKGGQPLKIYKFCQLCRTEHSPQWRQFRKLHVCNACGVKMYRHHESDYYEEKKRGKRATQENKNWAKRMAEKLMRNSYTDSEE